LSGEEKPEKVEDMEFVKRIVAFIKTKKPKTTSDFVEAGFFKDRNEGRKVLRQLAEKGILKIEKETDARQYSYTVPNAVKPKEQPKQ